MKIFYSAILFALAAGVQAQALLQLNYQCTQSTRYLADYPIEEPEMAPERLDKEVSAILYPDGTWSLDLRFPGNTAPDECFRQVLEGNLTKCYNFGGDLLSESKVNVTPEDVELWSPNPLSWYLGERSQEELNARIIQLMGENANIREEGNFLIVESSPGIWPDFTCAKGLTKMVFHKSSLLPFYLETRDTDNRVDHEKFFVWDNDSIQSLQKTVEYSRLKDEQGRDFTQQIDHGVQQF